MNRRRMISLLPLPILLMALACSTVPPEAELDWIREHAVVLETTEPGGADADLMPLIEAIGDARIVALGEATHGSREFFQVKHRLTEFLAREMGFTVFSIEASMPEAFRVDDYVTRGEGDPAELLAGMYFWTWNTESVLAMIEGMRELNASGAGEIRFTGFDMQKPDVAMEIVEEFLARVDPEFGAEIGESYDRILDAQPGAGFGSATASFPVRAARGKRVRFSGRIKTEKVERGFVGLWWRVDGPNDEALAFDNMYDQNLRGTTDWAEYAIEIDVPENAAGIMFGAVHSGVGSAWFDDLKIELDGREYDGVLLVDLRFEGNAIGFSTYSPSHTIETQTDEAFEGQAALKIHRPPLDPNRLTVVQAANLAEQTVERIEQSRDRYAERSSAEETEWAVQNARVVMQGLAAQAPTVQRDTSMAENVSWILDQAPEGTRIVLWAHNGHVKRAEPMMGWALDQKFGDEMVVIGFSTHSGRYTAVTAIDRKLRTHPLQSPPSGSLEERCHETGLGDFILDMRSAADDPAGAWLTEPVSFRSIGAVEMDQQFQEGNLPEMFDLMVYIDETTATRLLPPHKMAEENAPTGVAP